MAEQTETICPECESTDLRKVGITYGRHGKKQRLQCRKCFRFVTGQPLEG